MARLNNDINPIKIPVIEVPRLGAILRPGNRPTLFVSLSR